MCSLSGSRSSGGWRGIGGKEGCERTSIVSPMEDGMLRSPRSNRISCCGSSAGLLDWLSI